MIWKNMGPVAAIPFVMFIALMPGFGEEMLFRGYIQRRLLQRWSPALAILVSSILFAIVHVMPHAVVFAFPVGLWLGFIAWKTGSIWPTILGHVLINGIWNILNISSSLFGFSDTLYNILLIGLLLIGAVTFVWSWRLLQQVSMSGSADQPTRRTL
jgi:membrane protease YdiL (CAAX protease family)